MKIEGLHKFETRVIRDSVSHYADILTNTHVNGNYHTKLIKKNNSENRIIHCINRETYIYKLQQQLKNNFFDFIPLSTYAYGYIKGKSYYDYLKPHVKCKYYMKLDIKDFFHSIKIEKLREVLRYYINDTLVTEHEIILDFILRVVTLNGYLPQGAVTSPVISNIYFRQLDIRISRYCKKIGINYTRYVDDILLSSNNSFINKKIFINGIKKILKSRGFELNLNKTRKSKLEISLNGFVVGENLRLSRKKTALISELIYYYQHSSNHTLEELVLQFNDKYNIELNITKLHNFLAGYRSFLLGLLPFDSVGSLSENMTKSDKKNLHKINEIEKILDLTAEVI